MVYLKVMWCFELTYFEGQVNFARFTNRCDSLEDGVTSVLINRGIKIGTFGRTRSYRPDRLQWKSHSLCLLLDCPLSRLRARYFLSTQILRPHYSGGNCMTSL